jgi:hypothetical protein
VLGGLARDVKATTNPSSLSIEGRLERYRSDRSSVANTVADLGDGQEIEKVFAVSSSICMKPLIEAVCAGQSVWQGGKSRASAISHAGLR